MRIYKEFPELIWTITLVILLVCSALLSEYELDQELKYQQEGTLIQKEMR